jgi:hypothetical protein
VENAIRFPDVKRIANHSNTRPLRPRRDRGEAASPDATPDASGVRTSEQVLGEISTLGGEAFGGGAFGSSKVSAAEAKAAAKEAKAKAAEQAKAAKVANAKAAGEAKAAKAAAAKAAKPAAPAATARSRAAGKAPVRVQTQKRQREPAGEASSSRGLFGGESDEEGEEPQRNLTRTYTSHATAPPP